MPTIPTIVSDMAPTPDFIYLASQSPRRRQLLEQLGVRNELLLPDAHEDAEGIEAVLPNEAPAAYVQRVTQLKLDLAVQRLKRRGLPAAPILCSDTTVALGRKIYGKPADAQDAVRMLGDTLLFHMTRLNHMSVSCVSCGMCTSACPSDIPVGAIFSAIGEQVQAAFEYIPGRDLEEALPLITFQANEWLEVGEAK